MSDDSFTVGKSAPLPDVFVSLDGGETWQEVDCGITDGRLRTRFPQYHHRRPIRQHVGISDLHPVHMHQPGGEVVAGGGFVDAGGYEAFDDGLRAVWRR